MSTSDQPSTPQLTRKQLRELRNTGATPIVAPTTTIMPAHDGSDSIDPSRAGGSESQPESAPGRAPAGSPAFAPTLTAVPTPAPSPFAPPAEATAPVAPLPRAADPAPLHTAPVPDASVDLGASPLTRRQARQQERIRTASVPVIGPDLIGPGAFVAQSTPTAAAQASTAPAATAQVPREQVAPSAQSPFAPPAFPAPAARPEPAAAVKTSAAQPPASAAAVQADHDLSPWTTQHVADDAPTSDTGWLRAVVSEQEDDEPAPVVAAAPAERAVLNPMFGAGLLAADSAKDVDTTASFEQLLTRDTSTSGTATASHALILSHASGAPLVAPIAGTGELLVTGTLRLPEGLGSTGHAPGVTDGRDVDAVLVDGELPAHSSPTPIAASAAVSTIKTADEIIQPPTPERGGKLMVSLAITAGVLALALVGVLVYALASGAVS